MAVDVNNGQVVQSPPNGGRSQQWALTVFSVGRSAEITRPL
jgi:hypothetical protein